jgi:hypothetical protein
MIGEHLNRTVLEQTVEGFRGEIAIGLGVTHPPPSVNIAFVTTGDRRTSG